MMPNYLLALSASSLVVLAIATLFRVPANIKQTVSWHIAQSKVTIWFARILLPFAGTLLAAGAIYAEEISLKMLIFSIGLGFTLLGLVPYEIGRLAGRIHDSIAWLSAVLGLLVNLAILIRGGHTVMLLAGSAVQIICLLAIIYSRIVRRHSFVILAEVIFFAVSYAVLMFAQ